MSKLLTISEAAKVLGLNLWTLRRRFNDGSLPTPLRLGERRVILASDIPALRRQLKTLGLATSTPRRSVAGHLPAARFDAARA